jgi:hypothetical protein
MTKREIYAKEILNDIRSGMDYSNLMEKYKLTLKGLDSAFRKLLSAGLISEKELNSGKRGYEETVNLSGLFALGGPGSGQTRQRKKKEYFYSGMVEGIDILDHIQWILLDGRRTILEISLPNGTSCRVYLKEGQILHATNGEQEGEEALYSSVMFPGGKFVHLCWTGPDRRTIDKPGIQLLLEASRRRDEANW